MHYLQFEQNKRICKVYIVIILIHFNSYILLFRFKIHLSSAAVNYLYFKSFQSLHSINDFMSISIKIYPFSHIIMITLFPSSIHSDAPLLFIFGQSTSHWMRIECQQTFFFSWKNTNSRSDTICIGPNCLLHG